MFYRLATDKTRQPLELRNHFGGTGKSACWLIGGGPSLLELPMEQIAASPLPKMTTNLAGCGFLRPTFWTSYDPSVRFQRSVYLDPSVMKFVHPRRAMDLVPETTGKVCDCPNLCFFDPDPERGFADFLSPTHSGIVDWNDTLVQAIDILYRLGFRRIYLAGCEMIVFPSEKWIAAAARRGVAYGPLMTLRDFSRQCEEAGLTRTEQEELRTAEQYHFDERKPLASAISTDEHYFRVAQYLRLCRRSISLAGVELISVTPGSRLNDYFPYETAEAVCRRECEAIGLTDSEPVRGFYTQQQDRQPPGLGPMRDFRPHHWKNSPVEPSPKQERVPAAEEQRRKALRDYLEAPPVVEIREEG
jgi:hypothetical protein